MKALLKILVNLQIQVQALHSQNQVQLEAKHVPEGSLLSVEWKFAEKGR